jgi:histidinol dehydrogenase
MTTTLPRLDANEFRARIRRRDHDIRDAGVESAVREIVADVRSRGDAAVREWTSRLDGVDVVTTLVDAATMESAWNGLDSALRNALIAAAQRVHEFHAFQLDTDDRGAGTTFLRPVPLHRAGCYVPGGRAAYPSTVLMSVIPAQVAGVESIAVCTPPGPSGEVHPLVAAAAHLLHIEELRAIGGAQAIAALAYGTETVQRVDKVVGPGNIFVTLAKREVFGAVGVDQLAGPSEIVVVASGDADAALIAADLISQLEHDPLAWAVCISDDRALVDQVAEQFARAAAAAARAEIIGAAAGEHAMAVVCHTLDEAIELAALFAPEHVSLQGIKAETQRDAVRNAGAVFVGARSPVSIGDYIAGPSHTLPTQGAARYRGPLSVMDFIRWPSVVQLSDAEFDAVAPVAATLADAEGLAGHSAAIRARMGAVTPRA